MPLSFALSISHFVSSVGADAGFAALIGLAILVLLYFAHARETSSVRSELLRANQRLEELERRVATGVSATVTPRPPLAAPQAEAEDAAAAPVVSAAPSTATAAPGSATAAQPPVGAPAVAAPAGVGAPPLTDATRVVPGVEQQPAESEEAPDERRAAAAPVAAVPLAVSQGTGAGPAPPPAGLGGAGAPGLGRTPAPMTAAGGGNGVSAIGTASGQPRSLLEHGLPGQRRSLRWLVPVVAGLVIAAIVVALVLALGSSGTHHRTLARHAHAKIAAAPPNVVPSSVTVAVVNGTGINQLAHHVGAKLSRRGFKEGALATASGRARSTTSVGYVPGQRNDALAVAHALKLPATAVRPAAQSSLSLVCPSASTCTADVVVVVGTDLAPKH